MSKIIIVTAMAFYCLLVAFGNITDYATNWHAVKHALAMNELPSVTTITYRAVTNIYLQQLTYLTIIFLESLTSIFCFIGAWKLFRVRKENDAIFQREKKWSIIGLTLGFLTWHVFFMSIGGEWYGLWMSPTLHNVLNTAFHILITFLAVLIYLVTKEE